MVQDFFSMERTTGLLLVSPSLIVIFLVVMTATGQGRNLFRPSSADIAAHVLTTRIGLGIGIAGMIAGLLGFTLLTMLIFDKGARVLPILALVLFALTTIFWVIEMSLRMSIGVWAAQQTAGTGSEPEIWTALFRWIAYLGSTYIATGYLALAGYGWAIVQTQLLPLWVGWVSIVYSGFWLIMLVVMRGGIPGTFLVPPFVMGIALFLQR